MNKAKISSGNMKIGKLPNVSLPPIKACNPEAPCFKECYALKAFRQYPDTRKAWTHNLNMALNNRVEYFQSIAIHLGKKRRKPLEFFRWHVSGDILDQDYLEYMKAIAKNFPHIKFLAFTKMHHLNFKSLPKNLVVVFSMWANWGDTKKKIPRAYMDDGTTKIPDSALHCPGSCNDCMMCWNLPEIKRDVYFTKH